MEMKREVTQFSEKTHTTSRPIRRSRIMATEESPPTDIKLESTGFTWIEYVSNKENKSSVCGVRMSY